MKTGAVAFLLSLAWTAPALAVPNPPPPFITTHVADQLVSAFTARDEAGYAQLFTDDVEVFKNEERIAQGKVAWMAIARQQMNSWKIRQLRRSISYKGILSVETVNNTGPYEPGVVRDCCVWAQVTMYTFNGQFKIRRVSLLDNQPGSWDSDEARR